jgi:hypothetical protein
MRSEFLTQLQNYLTAEQLSAWTTATNAVRAHQSQCLDLGGPGLPLRSWRRQP